MIIKILFLESYAQKAQVLGQLEQWDQAEQTLMECVELNGLFDQDRKDSNGHRAAQLSAALQLAHLTSSVIQNLSLLHFNNLNLIPFFL